MRIEEIIVNVIFDAGKDGGSVTSREGVVGSPIGDLPKPSRPGYDFEGWYLGDTRVTAETVLEGEEDIRLVARWARRSGEVKKHTVMWKQKLTAVILACCILFLGIATAVANRLIAIYYLKDEYLNEETGEVLSDRYTIKRENGVYKMFNREGDLMETTEHGYTSSSDGVRYEVYVAETSGNQYLINTSTGEYETYAVVDYNSELGESLGGTVKNKRVMMYPRVGQDNTYSIKVKNQHGEFELYRKNVESSNASNGKKYTTIVQIKGTEETLATYDPTLFASLCVSTGYMLTMQKLDFSDPETPRREDGSVRLEDYGLADVYDGEGNLTYTPAEFTITKANFAADGQCSPSDTVYTVKVGNAILSGGGYYVQLVGRDAVYIVSSDIANTVLQPVEAMVTPATIYPMTVSTYVMVYNFRLGSVETFLGSEDELEQDDNVKLISAFDFVDLAQRENSIYSSVPYWLIKDQSITNGYQFNSDSVSTVLGNLYQMEFVACKMLNPKEDADFEKYNLDKDVYIIAFDYDPEVANGGSEEKNWVSNMLVISQLTEDGTYYVYSFLYDMIVEVDQYYLSFLEWDQSKWYNQYFFQNNIAYIKNMSVTSGGKTTTFNMDNRFSYAYYDNGNGTGSVINLTKGTLSQDAAGNYIYTVTKTGKQHKVYLMDFTAGNTYRDKDSNKILYRGTGDDGKTILVDVSSSTTNLQVYCPQYTGANGSNLLDYVIEETIQTDTGTQKTSTYTALDNFRRLYSKLLWYSIEGDVSEKELGSDVKTYISTHDATAEIRFSLEDMASILNPEHFTENNTLDMVIRFYQYPNSDWKMLLTIEVLDSADATPDPTKGLGMFYVLASEMELILQYTDDLLNGVLIPSST